MSIRSSVRIGGGGGPTPVSPLSSLAASHILPALEPSKK